MSQEKKNFVIVVEHYHRSVDAAFQERNVFYYDDFNSVKKDYVGYINQFLDNQEQIGNIVVYRLDKKTDNYIIIFNSIFY